MKERIQTSIEIWASVVNEMCTGQRQIICQVVALCSQSRSCLRQGGVPEVAVH